MTCCRYHVMQRQTAVTAELMNIGLLKPRLVLCLLYPLSNFGGSSASYFQVKVV